MQTKMDLNNLQDAFEYKSDAELKRSVFVYKLFNKPWLALCLKKSAIFILKYNLPFKGMIKKTVFAEFCAGEDKKEAGQTISRLKKYNVNTVLDYVAEGDNDANSFQTNFNTICENILFVSQEKDAFLGVKLSGLEDVEFLQQWNDKEKRNVFVKSERFAYFKERAEHIARLGSLRQVKIYFDAEEKSTQDLFDALLREFMQKYNQDSTYVFNTAQMYLVDRVEFLKNEIELARKLKYSIGMKLVRGAYVEKERELARKNGEQSPVFMDKIGTDNSFDEGVRICLENSDIVTVCIATHNAISIVKAIALIEKLGIENHYNKVYFSQLYGMSDNLTFNLAKNKFNASKYVPYGEVEKAIPYLIRRAEENTSMEGEMGRELKLILDEIYRRKHVK
jgi:proline dehydrogenase